MNEPVAYGMLTFCKNCGEQNPYAVKELTDEEIQLLINDVRDYDIDTHDLFEFARAILRKAQSEG